MDGRGYIAAVVLALVVIAGTGSVGAWHDETHLAVAKVAGYEKWYNSAGADMAKIKAGAAERYNHYFDNPGEIEVIPAIVRAQISRYDDPGDQDGHLYGAIIASLRDYRTTAASGKYVEYHLAYCAHYVADLSQPLHNTAYDEFNRSHHEANDGIVETGVLSGIERIRGKMGPVVLRADRFEEDLAAEIARIAEGARMLGGRLRAENRDMTREEAYGQLGQSASLLRAILVYLGRVR